MPWSPRCQPWSPQSTMIVFLARPVAVERVEHAAELGVHVARRGVVAVDQRALQVVGDGARFRDVLVVAAARRQLVGAKCGAPSGGCAALGEFELRAVVEVPVFFRRAERQVRLDETDGQEERLVGMSWRRAATARIASSAIWPSA